MKNPTQFASGRKLDVICPGQLAIDLYAQQIGSRLEDVTSFSKYLGGSSAKIAFGTTNKTKPKHRNHQPAFEGDYRVEITRLAFVQPTSNGCSITARHTVVSMPSCSAHESG
jgi:hypothetical protein